MIILLSYFIVIPKTKINIHVIILFSYFLTTYLLIIIPIRRFGKTQMKKYIIRFRLILNTVLFALFFYILPNVLVFNDARFGVLGFRVIVIFALMIFIACLMLEQLLLKYLFKNEKA